MKNRGILHQLPEEARYIVFSEMPISVLGTTESAIERRGLGFFHGIKQSSCEGNYLDPAVSKLRRVELSFTSPCDFNACVETIIKLQTTCAR